MTRCNVFLFTCSVLTDVSASKPHSYHYHCSLSWPLPRRDAVLHARILHEATLSWLLSPELSSTNTHRLSPLPIKLSISYQYSSTLFIIIYILLKSQCCHRHLIELKCNVSIRGSAWWRNASSVPEIPELQTVQPKKLSISSSIDVTLITSLLLSSCYWLPQISSSLPGSSKWQKEWGWKTTREDHTQATLAFFLLSSFKWITAIISSADE